MSAALQALMKKEEKRLKVLSTLYSLTDGDSRVHRDSEIVFREALIEESDGYGILSYLANEGLISGIKSNAYGMPRYIKISITHQGVKEIEHVVKHPDIATEHFHVHVVQHFHSPVGVVQTGENTVNLEK